MARPRLKTWARREKLLLLVTLVYAFLLSLVVQIDGWAQVLRVGCHRTNKRSRTAATPLARLRSALGRLWLAYPLLALNRK